MQIDEQEEGISRNRVDGKIVDSVKLRIVILGIEIKGISKSFMISIYFLGIILDGR